MSKGQKVDYFILFYYKKDEIVLQTQLLINYTIREN